MSASSPFERPVDSLLRGLRWACQPDPYRLVPGSDGEPDHWVARCPVHPAASAYTLLITELPDGRADVWCSVGCDRASIVWLLVPDPEREARAEAYSRVLLWAQSYGKRRQP